MKKALCFVLTLTLLWSACSLALADAFVGGDAPENIIAQAFTASRWDGYEVAQVTIDGKPTAEPAVCIDGERMQAVAVMTNGKMNVLCVLGSNGKGGLNLKTYSDKAVKQGADIPFVSVANDRITVTYLDEAGNGSLLSYTFRKRDAQWILNNLSYLDEAQYDTIHVEVYDAKLVYENVTTDRTIGTAQGVYARKFEQFNVNTFPLTLKEAKSKLTLAPEIPESDSVWGIPQPKEIEFPSNKQYPVYAGPGEQYLRGANGKAAMATNDWVQVFGTEGDWALVQYDITSDQMRIGYITADALPKPATVPGLHLAYYPATITACPLTDDPLTSGKPLCQLPSSSVTFLAWLGNDWAYIETTLNQVPVRGFVPATSITITYPAEEANG